MATPDNLTDYGRDWSCAVDLLPTFGEVTGAELMAQVCMRRIYTPEGALFSAPLADTIDVRTYLSTEVDQAKLYLIQGACTGAISADPRVLSVTVTPTWIPATRTVQLAIAGEGAAGPFALTLAVSSVTVELLATG